MVGNWQPINHNIRCSVFQRRIRQRDKEQMVICGISFSALTPLQHLQQPRLKGKKRNIEGLHGSHVIKISHFFMFIYNFKSNFAS